MDKIDDYMLNDEDKKLVESYKKGWNDNKDNKGIRDSYHTLAEEVRRKNGYSGGTSGIEFIPVDTFKRIPVPDLQEYKSPYDDDINYYLNAMKNTPNYNSPYSTQINNLINSIEETKEYVPKYQPYIDKGLQDMINYSPYDYDPNKDPSYQRFLQNVRGASEEAYQDSLASFADLTGGYISSWAEASASQAMEAMNQMASEEVEKFDDLAYSKHVFETSDMFKRLGVATSLENQSIDQFKASHTNKLNLLHAILTQDEIKYNRVRDRINDDKQMGRFLLELDEHALNKFKYVVEQGFRKFEAEANEYRDEMKWKQDEVEKALQKTELRGYVGNEESFVLGVPTGTPSKIARQRAWAMEDFFKKNNKELDMDLERAKFKYEKDLELEELAHGYRMEKISLSQDFNDAKQSLRDSLSSSGGGSRGGRHSGGVSGGEGTSGIDADTLKQGLAQTSESSKNKAKKAIERYEKYFKGRDFKGLSDEEKYNKVMNVFNDVALNTEKGAYGKNGYYAGLAVTESLKKMPAVVDTLKWKATYDVRKAHDVLDFQNMLDPELRASRKAEQLRLNKTETDYYIENDLKDRLSDINKIENKFMKDYENTLVDFDLGSSKEPEFTDYRKSKKRTSNRRPNSKNERSKKRKTLFENISNTLDRGRKFEWN